MRGESWRALASKLCPCHRHNFDQISENAGASPSPSRCYADNGQLISGSFMDYAMPRASDLPRLDTAISEVPSTTHPLGMRGGGEGGISPALAALVNAVVDALSGFGIEHIEMPVTPERVWRTLKAL
jgi:CO/xanthine dehydrogenase Mo-binding subunit